MRKGVGMAPGEFNGGRSEKKVKGEAGNGSIKLF